MERYGSHYRPLVNRRTFDWLLNVCDTLDGDPRLWIVHSEGVREAIANCQVTLDRRHEAFDRLRGSAKNGAVKNPDRTARAKGMMDRRHLWATRPHVCELCGLGLVPNIARVHHVHQVQDGGSSDDGNMQLLCLNCNAKQHAR